ncbi:MAG: hypothetical protein M3X11_07105 [Acidobacteriota bacterium]|nr:hypothetical protein [Acidobacteriota bacterium]
MKPSEEAEPGGFGREMNTALLKAGRTKYWLSVLHNGGFRMTQTSSLLTMTAWN